MDIDKQTSHHLAVNNDVGVNVQVPVKINSRATRLAFSFYHRFFILHSLTRGKESELVNRNYSPYANIQNALGLGVRFKI